MAHIKKVNNYSLKLLILLLLTININPQKKANPSKYIALVLLGFIKVMAAKTIVTNPATNHKYIMNL